MIPQFHSFKYLFAFLFLIPITLFGQETTGWYSKNNQHRLYVDGIQIFSSSDGDRVDFPEKLTNAQEIEGYLYLAEYFLKKKSRQGIATILYKIRTKPKDYRLADALITTLWKKHSQEGNVAQKTLESYIRSENNSYYKSLAQNIYASLFTMGEDEKRSPERMNCNPRIPYYSFCRLFRLQYYLDRTSGKGESLEKHYANIYRVLSPFYEEASLHSIPFLEELDEDLPPRLAFLGLANESLNFQRIILESERASFNGYSENSLERLSFLQILAGKWNDAENSLKQLSDYSKNNKKVYRNKILIKLGMIAYLSGRYDDSLRYFMELDFTNWSSLITHPLLNEPLSIPEAKDLVSLSVWKTKGVEAAVTALRSIPKADKVYQEEVWPRLRIAQLIMESNPELSARIIEEISYLAQSRGWKRLEYISTILQGYNRILEQQYRKSTVEFTKSRGILGSEDAHHGNEWLRLSGMVFAHSASDTKAPVSSFIDATLSELRNNGSPDEDILSVRYYKSQTFDRRKFVNTSIDYLKDSNSSKTILELIVGFNNQDAFIDEIYQSGINQVISVNQRFQNLSGFQSHREENFQDSTYSTSRNYLADHIRIQVNRFDPSFEKSMKSPMVALLPWENNLYLFTMDPNQSGAKRWSHTIILGNNPLSTQAKDTVNQFIDSLSSPDTIQIYFNEEGMKLYEFFRKIHKDSSFNLFQRFVTNPQYGKDRNLAVVGWKKDPPLTSIKSADRRFFEGSATFNETNRLHLWDYKPNNTKELLQLEWKNGEDPNPISMKKIIRRLDTRTIPTAILVSSTNLGIGFLSDDRKVLDWSNYWLTIGTEAVYYKKNIDWKEATILYREMPIGISWNKDSDVIAISRDLR
ncbi:MAG: hypothetical protein JJT78_05180 [Leptospira sp.]|nr:hypothetical protein [Leptospira sp.]